LTAGNPSSPLGDDQPGPQPAPSPRGSERTERILAVLCYLSGVLPLIGPLTMYLLMKDRSRFLRFHAARSFNIQVTGLILQAVSLLLTVLSARAHLAIAYLFGSATVCFGLAMEAVMIAAAISTARGETLRAPAWLNFRVIRLVRAFAAADGLPCGGGSYPGRRGRAARLRLGRSR
jgi:uncharacterized protein